MTTNHAALLLLVSLLLYEFWDLLRDKLQCAYCGQLNGHEEHCPYRIGE